MPTTANRLLPLLCLGLLAGCGGGVTLEIPISGASTAAIDFAGGIPKHAENDDIRVEKALLVVDAKAKHANYDFLIREKNKSDRPTSVKIEDVTDDAPVTMVEDNRPELKDGLWEMDRPGDDAGREQRQMAVRAGEQHPRVPHHHPHRPRPHLGAFTRARPTRATPRTYYRQRLGLETQPAAAC